MRRGAKVAWLALVFAAGSLLAFAGAQPEGLASVRDVVADAEGYAGRPIAVKASVAEGSLDRAAEPVRFWLEDGGASLEVRWNPALPLPDHEAGGTIEGRSVVVEGVLRHDDAGVLYLDATAMQVGCASKYRSA